MSYRCKCESPPFHYQDYQIVELGEDAQGRAQLETCKSCGTTWLNYLIEEPHYTGSGRWWRVEVKPSDVTSLKFEIAREYIQSQQTCFVGGSFYDQGVHQKVKPICVQ